MNDAAADQGGTWGQCLLGPSHPFIQGCYEIGKDEVGGTSEEEGEVPGLPCRPALGIQRNAQALQHMLQHPPPQPSKPKQNTLQPHCVPRQKRVKLHP